MSLLQVVSPISRFPPSEFYFQSCTLRIRKCFRFVFVIIVVEVTKCEQHVKCLFGMASNWNTTRWGRASESTTVLMFSNSSSRYFYPTKFFDYFLIFLFTNGKAWSGMESFLCLREWVNQVRCRKLLIRHFLFLTELILYTAWRCQKVLFMWYRSKNAIGVKFCLNRVVIGWNKYPS